jgi:hypothetical protein
LFTLPVGYRPTLSTFFINANSARLESTQISIESNGNVLGYGLNETWTSLEQILFKVGE